MPILPISGLPAATSPFLDANLIALVQSGTTKKGTIAQLNETITAAFGLVTVGSTGAQYTTINAAYAAGKFKMWVISDVTETATTTYTSSLHIIVNDGVTIAANPDVKLIAGNTTSWIAWEFFGKPTISFSLTAPGTFMDASAATAVAPAIITKGLVNIVNTSDPTIAAEPMKATNALLDSIIYTTDGGIDSYFNFTNLFIKYFELSPTTAIEDSMGVKITGHGQINEFSLTADCSNSSVLYDINDATVGYTVSSNASGVPTCYLRNSKCQSATGIQQAIKFNMSAPVNGERSSLFNGLNVNVVLSGSIGSNIDNCLIAGINVALITGGITNITNSRLASPIDIANASTMCKFLQTEFSQGGEVSAGSHVFNSCNFGVPGGVNSYTMALGAASENCKVIGCYAEADITDAGTNNYLAGNSTF